MRAPACSAEWHGTVSCAPHKYICLLICGCQIQRDLGQFRVLSYIRKGKYSPATPTTAVYVMLRVPPLDSENRVALRALVEY